MIAESVLDLIGNTPLMHLSRISRDGGALYAKAEFLNPFGSVKERPALAMIAAAERNGLLRPGMTIVEPTSGNTGIGLAAVGLVKGYRVVLVVCRDEMAAGLHDLARVLGATMINRKSFVDAVRFAEAMVRDEPNHYFMPHQFRNNANPDSHMDGTAQELIRDLGGRLRAFVAAYGSGGTFTGVGRALKAFDPTIRVVLVEVDTVRLFSGGPVTASEIYGIGATFQSEFFDTSLMDEIVQVSESQANEMTRRLLREEGLLCGPSSGAMVHAACVIARSYSPSEAIATILPDRGERYLSEGIFFTE